MNTRTERARGRWRGYLGTAGALVLAALALLLGADRAGASLMPVGPFAQSALRQTAGAADAGPAEAAAAARALVSHAPLRTGHLSLLALRERERGQADAATAALAAALQTGWRDPLAQAMAVEWALAQGQGAVAALRTEALLRAAPDMELTRRTLAAAASDPATRQALAQAAVGGGDWPLAMLAVNADGEGPPPPVIALLDDARAAGWRPDPAKVRAGTWRLFNRDPALAWRYWTAALGPGDSTRAGLWQAAFPDSDGALPAEASPFEWRAVNASAFGIEVQSGRVMLERNDQFSRDVLKQQIILAKGAHLVRWRSSTGRDQSPDFKVLVGCMSPSVAQTLPEKMPDGSFQSAVSVRSSCPGTIVISKTQNADNQNIWIEGVVFSRVAIW